MASDGADVVIIMSKDLKEKEKEKSSHRKDKGSRKKPSIVLKSSSPPKLYPMQTSFSDNPELPMILHKESKRKSKGSRVKKALSPSSEKRKRKSKGSALLLSSSTPALASLDTLILQPRESGNCLTISDNSSSEASPKSPKSSPKRRGSSGSDKKREKEEKKEATKPEEKKEVKKEEEKVIECKVEKKEESVAEINRYQTKLENTQPQSVAPRDAASIAMYSNKVLQDILSVTPENPEAVIAKVPSSTNIAVVEASQEGSGDVDKKEDNGDDKEKEKEGQEEKKEGEQQAQQNEKEEGKEGEGESPSQETQVEEEKKEDKTEEVVVPPFVDKIIKLNVGGKKIATKRSTLIKIKGSYLYDLFSPDDYESKVEFDDEGYIFFDFNPFCFLKIINYLRALSISPSNAAVPRPTVPEDQTRDYTLLVYHLGFASALGLPRLVRDRFSASLKSPRMQISEDGFLIEHNCFTMGYEYAVSEQTYSDGVARFVLKIENVSPGSLSFIGVISDSQITSNSNRNDSINLPSCFGWGGQERVFVDGGLCPGYGGFRSDCLQQGGHSINLILNLERKVLMLDVESPRKERYVLNLCDGKAWRLHVNLFSIRDKIRLLQVAKQDS